jgi:hypothetical protein
LLKILGTEIASAVLKKHSPEQRLFQAIVLQAFEDALSTHGVNSGEIVGADESFYDERVYVTFEEVDRDVITTAGVGKTSVGVQVGKPSVSSGESNS